MTNATLYTPTSSQRIYVRSVSSSQFNVFASHICCSDTNPRYREPHLFRAALHPISCLTQRRCSNTHHSKPLCPPVSRCDDYSTLSCRHGWQEGEYCLKRQQTRANFGVTTSRKPRLQFERGEPFCDGGVRSLRLWPHSACRRTNHTTEQSQHDDQHIIVSVIPGD